MPGMNADCPQPPSGAVDTSAPAAFALWREDDNGARFLIAQFPSRAAAEARAEALAIGGHKQAYFVESVMPSEGT